MADAIISFTLFGKEISMCPERYFSVFGFTVHWYGVIIAVGMVLGVLYAMKRSEEFGINADIISDLLLVIMPLGVIGARALYVIFNWDATFKNNPMDMFKIWQGGLAIYGGIILAIFGIILYCRKKKIPAGVALDIATLVLIFSQSVGRWGNFVNRELYGVETSLPWAMTLTSASKSISVHPIFLYESLWNLIGFIFLCFFVKKRRYDGQIFALYVFWYGLARFWMELIKQDAVLTVLGTNIRVSSVIGLVSLLAALGYLVYRKIKNNYSPETLYVNRKKAESGENK